MQSLMSVNDIALDLASGRSTSGLAAIGYINKSQRASRQLHCSSALHSCCVAAGYIEQKSSSCSLVEGKTQKHNVIVCQESAPNMAAFACQRYINH
jgi:hypothetical protein